VINSASSLLAALPALSADDGAASPSKRASSFGPAAQAAADKKLAGMREAVTKLKSLGDTAKSTGSDIARQKLEALKQRLKMLMMMGGDPKTVAREAAQIAKEIGQAAKDYAAAAGGGSAGAAAATADATPPADAAQAAETAQADAPAATADTTAKPGAPKADGSTPDATPDKPVAKTTPASPSGPDPVIAEAKRLAAQAKAILKAALERAKLQHASPQELKEDEDKMKAADKDVADAARAVDAADAPSGYSASGQGVDAPAPAEPVVSVRA
jgi:hypothetical protein